MNISLTEIRKKLLDKGLKITPQRVAILEAVYKMESHPTAEKIIEYVRKTHPNIASGTVYKVLDTLNKCDLIKRVTTDKDVMRYDGIIGNHHHLYSLDSESIKDYIDEELDDLLENYFKNKKIEGFQIKEFVLQIKGTFEKH